MDAIEFESELVFKIKALRTNSQNEKLFCSEAITLCKLELLNFRKKIRNNKFKTVEEEIYFFKKIKQEPLHHLVFYSEKRSFINQFPIGSNKTRKRYINKKLDKLNRFFEYNLDFVQYIDTNQNYMDGQYFLRKNLDFSRITHYKFYNIDPEFNTSHDLLLAKVLAYKKFAKYLEKRLLKLHHPKIQKIPKSQLKWTSSKAALTELTYALYHGGAINNGNTDIREIATALERTFNFPIGDLYRTYSEIRSRKNRRSKFLDELSSSLISGMDTLDE